MESESGYNDAVIEDITVFKQKDGMPLHVWSWPPINEVAAFLDGFLPSSGPTVKTCFSMDVLPTMIPDVTGNKYIVAAHCLIYVRTNDVRKGCAMVIS